MNNAEAETIIRDLLWREIGAVIEEMRSYPEEKLWWTPAGIANSGGVLAQHLVGNLNHFIGHGLGRSGYVRQRDREFTDTSSSKDALITALEDVRETVNNVLGSLDADAFNAPYPIKAPLETSTIGFLIYLYHHLSYHHGQINYLRRIVSEAV